MKFLPFENITYSTKLSEEEVFKRLNDMVEPKKNERFGLFAAKVEKPYQGQITWQQFNIKRVIGYRNSAQPRIKGIIKDDIDGTKINVKMQLHIFVNIFLTIYCCFVGLLFITFLGISVKNNEFSLALLGLPGIIVFVYVGVLWSFKIESNKSKKDLAKIFDTEIINVIQQ